MNLFQFIYKKIGKEDYIIKYDNKWYFADKYRKMNVGVKKESFSKHCHILSNEYFVNVAGSYLPGGYNLYYDLKKKKGFFSTYDMQMWIFDNDTKIEIEAVKELPLEVLEKFEKIPLTEIKYHLQKLINLLKNFF